MRRQSLIKEIIMSRYTHLVMIKGDPQDDTAIPVKSDGPTVGDTVLELIKNGVMIGDIIVYSLKEKTVKISAVEIA